MTVLPLGTVCPFTAAWAGACANRPEVPRLPLNRSLHDEPNKAASQAYHAEPTAKRSNARS